MRNLDAPVKPGHDEVWDKSGDVKEKSHSVSGMTFLTFCAQYPETMSNFQLANEPMQKQQILQQLNKVIKKVLKIEVLLTEQTTLDELIQLSMARQQGVPLDQVIDPEGKVGSASQILRMILFLEVEKAFGFETEFSGFGEWTGVETVQDILARIEHLRPKNRS